MVALLKVIIDSRNVYKALTVRGVSYLVMSNELSNTTYLNSLKVKKSSSRESDLATNDVLSESLILEWSMLVLKNSVGPIVGEKGLQKSIVRLYSELSFVHFFMIENII